MSTERETISLASAKSPFFLGVDVGGTSIKLGLVDDSGRTIGFAQIPTNQSEGAERAMQRVAAAISDDVLGSLNLGVDDVSALGLGTPGTMDIPNGMILEPPNMPAWRDFPIRDCLAALCGIPVSYANDGGAAAFGEYWIGSGREYDSIVMLTLGTGVGGGIIVHDRSIDGAHSHGAECGHIIIDTGPDARICSCGQRGHVEAYASATGVVKRTQDALEFESSSLATRIEAGEELTALMVSEEAERGDALARRIVAETADYLAIACITLAHTIDPGAIILGGAMNFGGHDSPQGRAFLARIRQVFRERTFPVISARTAVDFARLGSDAGYLGAAGIARESFRGAATAAAPT